MLEKKYMDKKNILKFMKKSINTEKKRKYQNI